jgi:hypothetical protein
VGHSSGLPRGRGEAGGSGVGLSCARSSLPRCRTPATSPRRSAAPPASPAASPPPWGARQPLPRARPQVEGPVVASSGGCGAMDARGDTLALAGFGLRAGSPVPENCIKVWVCACACDEGRMGGCARGRAKAHARASSCGRAPAREPLPCPLARPALAPLSLVRCPFRAQHAPAHPHPPHTCAHLAPPSPFPSLPAAPSPRCTTCAAACCARCSACPRPASPRRWPSTSARPTRCWRPCPRATSCSPTRARAWPRSTRTRRGGLGYRHACAGAGE